MSHNPKSRFSAADRLVSRGFSLDQLQNRVGELDGLKVFQNIAKPTQDAHNSMGHHFYEYLDLLSGPRYNADEVLAHGAPYLPLSMCTCFFSRFDMFLILI